jgi:hypothetical protein
MIGMGQDIPRKFNCVVAINPPYEISS